MFTPEACGVNSNFVIASNRGVSILQGDTDIGNHCLNCSTAITLPFSISLYDRTFTTAIVSSNGIVQFGNSQWVADSCLPNAGLDYAVLPYWGPFRTEMGGAIYTRQDGQAPDRVFAIEWRVCRSTGPDSCGGYSNFEVRFHENSPTQQFEFVYGILEDYGIYGSVGVQKGSGSYITQYSCHTNSLSQGTQLTFTLQPCDTATPNLTSTPTACTLSFTDVPQGSTFYPYVHCLACRGIINGYPDGTFKPGEQVSRGQLAKIVSNSAGFQEPVGAQMFEDVVPGSTFYDFVWRLAGRGYISGYPCGGVGEPCGPANLPYFRPSNNATRGQISKIVSNAAGFGEPPGAQMFEDVVPGSTFYDYVQRLASRGIISGYPCGEVGEPCGPASLPYFRPNDNATRGQTAKIDANSFFPGCAINGA
jgi:hypothetical protein